MVNKEEFKRKIIGKRKIQLEINQLRKQYLDTPNKDLQSLLEEKHKELVTFK